MRLRVIPGQAQRGYNVLRFHGSPDFKRRVLAGSGDSMSLDGSAGGIQILHHADEGFYIGKQSGRYGREAWL